MTQVKSDDNGLIANPFALFASDFASHQPHQMGVEAEFFALNRHGVATVEGCQNLSAALTEKGYQPSLEFAGIIEFAGPPHEIRQQARLQQELRQAQRDYRQTAIELGYRLANASHVAGLTVAEAERKSSRHPRAQAGLKAMQMSSPLECRMLPLLNASVQVSLNVQDEEDLFSTLALAYRLSPLIYAAFNNHPAQINGGQCCAHYHPRGKFYEAYGKSGGISEAFATASSASEFSRLHVESLYHTPLFFHHAPGQSEPIVSNGELVTLGALPEAKQTVSNFRLAESFNYHDVKVCNIRDEANNVTGKRLEVRAFDTSFENMLIAPLFCYLALRQPQGRAGVEQLLSEVGYSGTPLHYASLLKSARHNAVHHKGKPMQQQFGQLKNGESVSFTQFAQALGQTFSHALKSEPEAVKQAAAPLLCRLMG